MLPLDLFLMRSFQVPVSPVEAIIMRMVQAQKLPGIGAFIRMVLLWMGIQIPPQTFTRRPQLAHIGTFVIHEKVRFASRVTLYHGVTIGRANIWEPAHDDFEGFVIEDGVVLCAGATVLASHGTLTVGEGTVVGANAVLTQSTGPNELWAGSPARKVRDLDRP